MNNLFRYSVLHIFLCVLIIIFSFSCKSQYNKGVTNKKDFRPRNPPSVRIQQDYDKAAKRATRGEKSLKGKDGKALMRAQDKMKYKKMKKDKRYIKRAKKAVKKNN